MIKRKKISIFFAVFSLIISACGAEGTTSTQVIEDTTTNSSTTTLAPTPVVIVDEAALVMPPILLKPLIGATGILVSGKEDWEVIKTIVPLDMGVKIRTADNGTAQMTFEDGSSLLMGGNSVINVRSFSYEKESGSRILTVDVISGSIAYDIFSEGLTASLAKIVTPTAELSVHGTEGVFEYDVSTFSAKSTVLEGGEKTDDAIFSELLPDKDGNPVLVAVSQTAGTELGSATTGGSGWIEEDSSTVALIIDDFVSNMEGECSYTCKAATQESLADGSESLTAENAADAVFTEGDSNRMNLASSLLVAAGAPEGITNSVQELGEAVAEVAVPEEQVQEFIDKTWDEAPSEDSGSYCEDNPGACQSGEEGPPTEFFEQFGDASQVSESNEFENFDHEDHGDFRSQHGMMQFISADTNAVNKLAETGDMASAMALAASNMFVNAGEEEYSEGTFCYDNPDDPGCENGSPSPEFLALAFKGNHFVEDMVQDMGFEYSFTENEFKPDYCTDEPWLSECSDGAEYHGDDFEDGGLYCESNPDVCAEEGDLGLYGEHDEDSFCYENPEEDECQGGNSASVYSFFHVYDEGVLGDEWEPVDCEAYPDDSMCTGEGDFFHEHVVDSTAIALDRSDMFKIFGGPEEVSGPPEEFCAQNQDSYECSSDYTASDVYSTGEYVAPSYCDEAPDSPECNEDFGSHDDAYDGPLTGDFLSQYVSPEEGSDDGPAFCAEYPDHPECSRDYHSDNNTNQGVFLSNVFSDDAGVDLAQQAQYNNTIEAADDLADSKYGNHDEYYVLDCALPENTDHPDCLDEGNNVGGLYAGGEGTVSEYENIGEENSDEICITDPNNPVCYEDGEEDDTWDHQDNEGEKEEGGFSWSDEDNADQYSESQEQHEEFEDDFCTDNPEETSCGGGGYLEGGTHEDDGAYCEENPGACEGNGENQGGVGDQDGGDHGDVGDQDGGDHGDVGDQDGENHGDGSPIDDGSDPGYSGDNVDCSTNPSNPACGEGYGGPSGTDCSLLGNQSLPECGGGETTFDCSDPAYASQCSGEESSASEGGSGQGGGGNHEGGEGNYEGGEDPNACPPNCENQGGEGNYEGGEGEPPQGGQPQEEPQQGQQQQEPQPQEQPQEPQQQGPQPQGPQPQEQPQEQPPSENRGH